MATKQPLTTTFDVGKVIAPIFTGGSIAIDNNVSILATTLGENVVLTDPATGRNITKIEGDGELVSTMTITPSGTHLIVCSRSLSMKIYSLRKSSAENNSVDVTLVRTLKPHATPVVVLAVDRTSTLLATGGTDGAIKVWDVSGGFVTHTFRGPNVLASALRFFEVAGRATDEGGKKEGKRSKKSTDATDTDETGGGTTINFRLAAGFQDGNVRVWDLHRRNCIANLDSHVSDVQAIDFSPTQQALVSVSRDKTIIWWDTRSWKVRKLVPCFEMLETVGFVDDGHLTYTGGEKGCLRVWDTESGREVTAEQDAKHESEAIVGSIFRPEIPFIICTQMDHTLALYHPPSKANLAVAEAAQHPFRRVSGTHDEIIDLAYVTPDRTIMALATNAEEIRLVSTLEPKESSKQESWLSGDTPCFGQDVGLLKGHDDIILTLDTDWSGCWIATGAKDNSARLWRIDPSTDTYECYAVFTGHAESIGAVGLPKTVPQESSQAFQDPLNHPPPFLITGSQDQTVKRWDIPRKPQEEGKKGGLRAAFTRKAHEKDINAVDIYHNGSLFASASQDKIVKIWSVEEGEVQGILRGHRRGVWSVRFAPPKLPALQGQDGSISGMGTILTGSGDKTVKLWNLSDYSCIRTFEGHSNSVLKVAWLNVPKPQDQPGRPLLVASAGGDGLVKVWDINSGEAECTLDNHEDRVWALAVHPETNAIASGSGDSTVTFWEDTTKATQAAATEAAHRVIEQEQELENHIHVGSYREAITLALQLNHPGRLLSLFTKVVTIDKPEPDSLCGLKAVDHVLANLSDEQIFLLLLRLRDWNANARTAPVAQRILSTLVRSYPSSRISNLSVKGARGQKSLKEVLHALKVYTDRHYKRMEELVDESYLVEYTLQEMDSLVPSLDGEVVMQDV
ncbi:related to UTP13 - U3 snoRNP protein [Cephalotrichum gorgonifer]|uniref:Related to UTP13 - U3 snoRNP protein n=1 Tax=Cephalotrichum gorgonifer TaxID=2041049 RepID=A0AAE8SRW7_9PEZI|nr:related to UTP13 - U3 snoRNP protein [Cephalotrichum gorgonifer]